jgi:deoxyribose-phosphate aldolase
MTGAAVPLTRAEMAALIDHTLLRPEAVPSDIVTLCQQAVHLSVHAVCLAPPFVALAAGCLTGTTVEVVAVIGFPSGAHAGEVKATEAARAAADGTDEADMVMNLGLALSGDWGLVTTEVADVRAALGERPILKVIIESALLSHTQIVAACRAAADGGADFVKSSTGFHPAGGATVEAIAVMADTVGGRLGVKAAGGIRDACFAQALIGAGATRLGLSASAAILDQLDQLQEAR